MRSARIRSGLRREAAAQGIEHPVKRDGHGGWFHKLNLLETAERLNRRVDPSLNDDQKRG